MELLCHAVLNLTVRRLSIFDTTVKFESKIMQSIAYNHASRQNERRLLAQSGRRVSLSKAGMILASLALWAAMIGGVVLAAH
ncbi:hypothetical protein BH10PSE3_BH10PSE3_31900 [soil metagenome]